MITVHKFREGPLLCKAPRTGQGKTVIRGSRQWDCIQKTSKMRSGLSYFIKTLKKAKRGKAAGFTFNGLDRDASRNRQTFKALKTKTPPHGGWSSVITCSLFQLLRTQQHLPHESTVIQMPTKWSLQGFIPSLEPDAPSETQFKYLVQLRLVQTYARLNHLPGVVNLEGWKWTQQPWQLCSCGQWPAPSTAVPHTGVRSR